MLVDILKIGLPVLSMDMDPLNAPGVANATLRKLVYASLVEESAEGVVVGGLADYWRVGKDHRVFSFCVKKQSFHNGDPIEIEDIRFSIQRVFDREDKNFLRRIGFGGKAEVLKNPDLKKKLKRTNGECFDIQLSMPLRNFIRYLTGSHFRIVPRGIAADNTNGSGKFRVIARDATKKEIVLQRVEAKSPPYYNRIKFFELPSGKTIEQLMESGELDVKLGSTNYQMDFGDPKTVKVSTRNVLSKHMFFLNVDRPVLANIKFRQDLKGLFNFITRHTQQDSKLLKFHPFLFPMGLLPSTYYNQSQEVFLSPEEFAKKWNLFGQNLTIRAVAAENELPTSWVNEAKAALAKIGVTFSYENLDYAGYIKALRSHEYDLFLTNTLNLFDDSVATFASFNLGLVSAKQDLSQSIQLTDKLREINELDNPETRSRKVIDLAQKLEDHTWIIPLYQGNYPIFHSSRVTLPDNQYKYSFRFEDVTAN